MTHPLVIQNVVEDARKRQISNLALREVSLALCVFLGAFALLLVVGTAVLNWYWPVLLGVAAGAWGYWRLRRTVPGPYQTAQELDERTGGNDLLATAWHYIHVPESDRPKSRFIAPMTERAERTAAGISVPAAFPLEVPREAWVLLGMIVLAATLLAVRYGVLHTLDLRAALVEVQFDTLTGVPEAPARKKGMPGLPPGQLPPSAAVTLDDEQSRLDDTKAPEDALQTVDVPDVNQAGQTNPSVEKRREGMSSGKEGEEGGESGEAGEPGEKPGKQDEANASPQESKSKQTPANKQGEQGAKDSNSMLDKMRDAFANMMDKLNIQPKTNEGQQTSSTGRSEAKDGQRMDQKGTPSQNKSQTKGDPNSDAQADQQGEASDQAQGNKSSQGEKSEQASNQQKSGMGSSDGKKDTELAEQMDALGKISEILGKRSANINGEMMVEVQNSKQQLKTPYQLRQAAHGDTGAEINRDEVPLHLHQYVQQYYEQVRKPAPAQPAAPAKQ